MKKFEWTFWLTQYLYLSATYLPLIYLTNKPTHLICIPRSPHIFLLLFTHSWTPWTVARQAPLSMGFSRQEHWSGLPFPSPGDLPDSGIQPASPILQVDSLPLSQTMYELLRKEKGLFKSWKLKYNLWISCSRVKKSKDTFHLLFMQNILTLTLSSWTYLSSDNKKIKGD